MASIFLCFCVFSKFPQGMWVIFIIQKTIILKKCYVVVKQHQGQRVMFCKTSGVWLRARCPAQSGIWNAWAIWPCRLYKEPLEEASISPQSRWARHASCTRENPSPWKREDLFEAAPKGQTQRQNNKEANLSSKKGRISTYASCP